MKLAIRKVRFGSEGNWGRVEYQARILDDEFKDLDIRKQWRLGSNHSLDELAIKLMLLANAHKVLQLFPEEGQYVSLVESGDTYKLTQDMHLTDEELGELGAFVQKYIIEARRAK
ncbi:MAG: hypothetical protein AB1668_06055 [Nanoarchaeota archaeon]